MTKKKNKKTKLHVVENKEEDKAKAQSIWSLMELTDKLKKARKRIKKLETKLEAATSSNDTLKEEHATLVKKIDGMDTRTQRMGIALRECMKQLGVARPE